MGVIMKVKGIIVGLGLVLAVIVNAQTNPLQLIDCIKDAQNPKCVRPTSEMIGTIGSGVIVNQGGSNDVITGGFVQGNTLFASVSLGNTGALIAFNLLTGDRELISGLLNPNETRGAALRYAASQGDRENTTAYSLNAFTDVKPLPNGNYLGIMRSSVYRMELIEINAKTGDRTLFWASEIAPDTHANGLRDKEKYDTTRRCPERGSSNRSANPTSNTVAVDSNGNAYLQFNNNPQGIGYGFVRIKNGKCEDLSTYDLELNDEVGSGFKTPREEVNHMIIDNNILYSVSYFADTGHLLATNLETGARQLISHKDNSAARTKGKGSVGVGTLGVALNSDGFWTSKETGSDFKLIRVDPKTGDRTLVEVKSGPLSKGLRASTQKVFAIANSSLLLVTMDSLLFIFDPKTGNSNLLSY
jgi:hypothetical protein